MLTVTWNNEDGSRDYQECSSLRDAEQCMKEIIIPGGGLIHSIRIHEVAKSLDVQDDLQIIPGRTIYLDFQ